MWTMWQTIQSDKMIHDRRQIVRGFSKWAAEENGIEVVEWMIIEAGLLRLYQRGNIKQSHLIRQDTLSNYGLLTFDETWLRIQFDQWYSNRAKSKNGFNFGTKREQ